jgi:hypothetical protein
MIKVGNIVTCFKVGPITDTNYKDPYHYSESFEVIFIRDNNKECIIRSISFLDKHRDEGRRTYIVEVDHCSVKETPPWWIQHRREDKLKEILK